MKRWMMILSLLLFLLVFNSVAFGANGIINVSMNGSNVQVKEVPILMDGQAFVSDVPSFIYVDRTLVPIRFVAENFGAKVEWDQKTKTATVRHENKVVKLTIDSNKVVSNNETVALDNNSIPKLVTFSNNDSRTMVPVRFISEVLGYKVGWDNVKQVPYINSVDDDIEVIDLEPETKPPTPAPTPIPIPPVTSSTATIKSIEVVKGSTAAQRVKITSDKDLKFDTLFLPDSNKLVIDIIDSKLSTSAGDRPTEIKVADVNFNNVSYYQYNTSPYTTRIVVTMTDELDYNIAISEDGKTSIITFEEHQVKDIYKDIIDGKEAIVIDNISNVSYNILKLKSPERIVIDLMDSTLVESPYMSYDLQLGFIKGIRASQFSGATNYSSNDRIVRIVLDVIDGVTNPNIIIDTDKDRMIIIPEKSFWENISYSISGTDKLITINNLERTSYDVNYDSESKEMDIIIPSDSVDLIEGIAAINDGFIEDINISKGTDDTKVTIKFRRGIEFDVLSEDRDDKIQLAIRRDPNIKITDKTIVLDPGHGGKDPGAISPNGTKEKDVNLGIALKSESYLNALGYDVIMTRRTDTYVDLYERANIANRNYADIFISIHHNSNLNGSVYGLEILYCPRDSGTAKTEEQYPLAKAINEGIIASTGGKDRGIIQRPGLVVIRETNMSSILVEVGYLSNAVEEGQILNDEYQNKVVQGIISGIQKYFELY